MRKIVAIALLLALTGIAAAQQYGMIPLSVLTGAERIVVNNGGSTITTTSLAQIRDGAGYGIVAPLTGTTVQAANNTSILVLNPAGTLAALTVNLPLAPFDGQRVQIFTSQAVTAFTLTAGQTVSPTSALTALTANQTFEYVYFAAAATWTRCQ